MNLNKIDVDLNAQARNLLFQGISRKEFDRVAHINSAHLIWKTHCDYHKGTTKIKKVRKNLYQKEYSDFAMKPGESIDDLFDKDFYALSQS